MPRHVHMAPDPAGKGHCYIVEKIMVMEGVAVAELGGEFYVLPPHTLVLIGAGVPHTWTACPPGIDFGALGFSTEEKVVSKGKFVAVFEYEAPYFVLPDRANKHFGHGRGICQMRRSARHQDSSHDGRRNSETGMVCVGEGNSEAPPLTELDNACCLPVVYLMMPFRYRG